VNDLIEHTLRDVDDRDVEGITIQNQAIQNDKPIGITFRRIDQLSADMIWSVKRVSNSNSIFNALDMIVVTVHSIKMPVGFGTRAIKSWGRPLSVMAQLKRSILEVHAEENYLENALIIAIAKVDKDPNYKAYRQGRKIRHMVQTLLESTGIDLSCGERIPELIRSQEHFREYNIVVYHGLSCENIMFEEQIGSAKRLNMFYDDVERHYHVNANLTGAMTRKYLFKGCKKHVQMTSRTAATRL